MYQSILITYVTTLPSSHELRVPSSTTNVFILSCSICPIFTVSSVSGTNIPLSIKFLNVLPPLHNSQEREQFLQEHTEHQVSNLYH